MSEGSIGVIHPGEMGAAIAGELVARGAEVCFASEGRSEATRTRAGAYGLTDAGTLEALLDRCEIVFSIVPPDAALELARRVAGYRGVFVDANAVAPRTAQAIATVIEDGGGRYVDGGIIGLPPDASSRPRLYLSGASAKEIAALFDDTNVVARVVSEGPTDASAVKMAYSAWTKGTTAMLVAVRAFARAAGVEASLLEEWGGSGSDVIERSNRSVASVRDKAWRWAGEMEEISVAFGDESLPTGFHASAAEVYRRCAPDGTATAFANLDEVLATLLGTRDAKIGADRGEGNE